MNTGTVLLLGAGGLLLFKAYETGNFANTVDIIFKGVEVQNLNTIVCQLVVNNITDLNVQFKSMSGTLYLNGNQIAGISDFTPRTIASNAQTEIDVRVSPDIFSIISNLQNLLSIPGSKLNFNVQGNVNIEGLPILPFDLDKTMTV